MADAGESVPLFLDDPAEDGPGGGRHPHVVLVTGLSGGGKTAAAKLFEDLAYTVVDNLPGELLGGLAELVSEQPQRDRKSVV